MRKKFIAILVIVFILFGFTYTGVETTNATGEFREYLDIIVWGTPSTILPVVNTILITGGNVNTANKPETVTSFSKLEEKLKYNGYHVICLFDTDKAANHDMPEELEKLIEDRCCNGISGLIVSGYLLEPSANNKILQKLVGAQHKEETNVGRTMVRVIDMDHEIVRDVAQSFQCHLGTIHDPICYPSTHLIAQTNEGVKTVWTNEVTCESSKAKAGYIAVGNSGMAFGNVEIKRIFCHMLYYVMGSGWLQQKESPLNVRAINGDGKVLLKWEPPEESDSCYGYRVYRQKNGGEWVQIHDFPLIDGETEWLDTTVDNGENYVYKVCCVTATDYNVACSYHAKAQPSKPVLSVDPNLPKPGETVEVVGSEYTVKGTATPGSKVVIKWKLKPSGISGEVEVIADENGNYEAKIPLTPGQTVEYTITVENELGDSETIGPFFVKCIQEEIIMLFTIGSKTAYVNGIEWPTQLDAAPFIVESSNRTVVPFRFIGERIGATLDYSPKDAAVEKVWYEIDSAVEGHVLVEVWINKTTAKKKWYCG